MEIESGSIVIISGESGSGKTTLLNIIGTIEDYEGTILYDGKRLKKKEILTMRRDELSFIFQNYGLIENETVYENFKVIQNYKNNKHRIKEVLSMVGLQGFGTRKVFELSGGEQQQRVAISKAIFKNASLILADEPTASIDDKNKHIVIELFKILISKVKQL